MGTRRIWTTWRWISSFVLLTQCVFLEGHNHQLGDLNGTTISDDVLEDGLLLSLKCASDAECNVKDTNNLDISSTCDTKAKLCRCPSSINGTKVTVHNDSCIVLPKFGDICEDEFECAMSISGAICSSGNQTERTCQCPLNMKPSANFDFCEITTHGTLPGSDEFKTLKWLCVLFIFGYPILTIVFAIYENGTENCLVKYFLAFYKKSQKKRRRSRRNTDADLVSTDDEEDDSQLEMEIV